MRNNRMLILGLAALAWMQISVFALPVQFDLTTEFDGQPPIGPLPWATVQITDSGPTVLLNLSIGINDIDKINEWFLNFTDRKDVSRLRVTGENTSDVGLWNIDKGVNRFKADGGGNFDLRFSFLVSGNVFTSGESLSFRISSLDASEDLNPEDFNELSVGGTKGNFHSAAHVLGFTCAHRGWIGDSPLIPANGVPDGSWTITLLGMGVTSLEFLRRKLRKA